MAATVRVYSRVYPPRNERSEHGRVARIAALARLLAIVPPPPDYCPACDVRLLPGGRDMHDVVFHETRVTSSPKRR